MAQQATATATTSVPLLKTPYRREKEERELKIYNEYTALMSRKGQPVLAVIEHLMAKYNIHSMSTVYSILKRVGKRSAEEGGNR